MEPSEIPGSQTGGSARRRRSYPALGAADGRRPRRLHPIVYALGSVGRRLLIARGHTPRRLSDIGERYIAHALAVTELVVRLAEADRDGRIEVIRGVQSEPSCWRGFLAGIGTRLVLKPDLFLRTGAGALEDRWFTEVDLGTESSATIARKATRYVHYLAEGSEQARHGVFPRVLFTAPNQRRLEQLRRALAGVGEVPSRPVHGLAV